MGDYNDFKKKDKSEKVTVVHVEPVRQLIRWTDEGCKRFSKDVTTPYTKANSVIVGVVRNEIDLLDYNDFDFLEDHNTNPFLTHDDQFFLMEI